MLALLGYPFVIEPLLAVKAQSRAFHTLFAVYAVFVVLCAAMTMRSRSTLRVETTPAPPAVRASDSERKMPIASTAGSRLRERLLWVGLAFAPSSLLLGATEYVTTDLASIPLLWVIPLALYLASFIVAFGKRQIARRTTFSRLFALVVVLVSAIMLARVERAPWVIVALHMTLLFLASVVCHRALAENRPHVARLTEFYLLLSVGGVLGGLFNGIVAPLVFEDLFEYPVAIGLACLGRAILETEKPAARDVVYGLALGAATYALVKIGAHYRVDAASSFVWMFAPPLLVAFVWAKRPLRFAVAVGAVLVSGMTYGGDVGVTLFAKRNFFGVLKVTREPAGQFQLLVYGHRTLHGKQALDVQARHVPLAYYHPTGPAGDVLDPSDQRVGRRVGVIGLGIGSLVAYADPGDEWTFFEINPTVVDVARRHFTYLSDAEQGAKVDIEIGDARLRLRQGPEARFDVVVLDALSSDAIPIHLVTREALAVYRRALRPNGLILAHVTHDHLVLQPILAALAREASMPAIEKRDGGSEGGKHASEWVVLGGSAAELARLRALGWTTLEAPTGQSVWTDDYANVLGAIRL
jgi:SAM-dependent methyltransferase